jgi:hypothetical protein
MKKRLLQLGIYLPHTRVEGQYNLQGKVLILPLLGNGPAKLYLSEYSGQYSGEYSGQYSGQYSGEYNGK